MGNSDSQNATTDFINNKSSAHKNKTDHKDHADFDVDDAVEEVQVNEQDLREEARTFSEVIKTTNILHCIGKLVSKFKDSSGNKFGNRGTGTVYKVHNGYAYVLTAAHNLRFKEYWVCTACQQRNKTRKCGHCSSTDFSKAHILKPGKIYFERKTLKGEFEEKYDCDVVSIEDALYEKHPFPAAGYDLATLKFKDDSGYYADKCKNIMLINGCRRLFDGMKIKNKSFYIFGYPAFVKGKTDQRENMWGGQSIEDEFTVIKHKKTGCFYLTQDEVDASKGTSGAAIFSIYEIDNVHYTVIFAVHTGGNGNDIKYISGAYNIGVFLNETFDAKYDETFEDLAFKSVNDQNEIPDRRCRVPDFEDKDEHILKCIGYMEMTWIKKNGNDVIKRRECATGTVFHVGEDGSTFVLTCAHNVAHALYCCSNCGNYSFSKKQNCCAAPDCKREKK
eukprot:92884_1